MTLHPSARRANIEGSVRDWIVTQLAAIFASGEGIDLGDEPFNDEGREEWLQVRLLEPARPRNLAGPRTADGDFGSEIFHVLNLNVFVRPAALLTPNALRLHTLSDAVREVVMPGSRIPVKDYSFDAMTLGNLMIEEIMSDRPIEDPERVELRQWNLAVGMRWTETWSEFLTS